MLSFLIRGMLGEVESYCHDTNVCQSLMIDLIECDMVNTGMCWVHADA